MAHVKMLSEAFVKCFRVVSKYVRRCCLSSVVSGLLHQTPKDKTAKLVARNAHAALSRFRLLSHNVFLLDKSRSDSENSEGVAQRSMCIPASRIAIIKYASDPRLGPGEVDALWACLCLLAQPGSNFSHRIYVKINALVIYLASIK